MARFATMLTDNAKPIRLCFSMAAALWLLSACQTPQSQQSQLVIIEPNYQNTIKFTRALTLDDTLQITINQLQPNEALRMHKCGIDCTTASMYRIWQVPDVNASNQYTIPVKEPGRYYFWLQDQSVTDGSEQQVVQAVDGQQHGNTFTVTFKSGSQFSIALE